MRNLSDIVEFEKFDNLELLAKQIVEGFLIGLHRSPFNGFSVEFAEHRLYNEGESTKHVDWKLFARSDKMFVKQYEEETNLRANIVIDTSSSMLFPYKGNKSSKLAFSVLSAAALIHLLRKQRDAVGLSSFSDKIDLLTPSKLSLVHAQGLFSELLKMYNNEEIGLNRETNIAKSLHQLATSLPKRSLVIIFSDLMGEESPKEIFEALQHLRYKKHEVILFCVQDDKLENKLEFKNLSTKFIDLETKREIKINPQDIRRKYIEKQNKYFKELDLLCGQFSIDLVRADINNDFADVLHSYLLKRKKLM